MRRGRHGLLAALALAVIVAACAPFGRRGGAPRPAGAEGTPATPAPPPRTPPADSAGRPRADSARAAGDTARPPAADSGGRPDSAAARPDSAKAAAAARRRPPAPATRPCVLDFADSPPESRVLALRQPNGLYHTFIGGGVAARCQGEPATLRADSAEHLETTGLLYLIGNVAYNEPGALSFTSRRATYFTTEERIIADSAVVATQLKTGSSLYAQQVEYFRAAPGRRATSRIVAPLRPTVRLEEADKGPRAGPPVIITANTLIDEADSLLFAIGEVDINRAEINARADSGAFDKGTSRARLVRNASIISRDTAQPYRLTADTIDLFTQERALERVLATSRGRVTNRDLVLNGEIVDLRVTEGKLDAAYAHGPKRAKATTPEQELESDSLRIVMPAQRVERIDAVGKAVALGRPDTVRIRTDERDVMRGDTIRAHFDTLRAAGDTSARPRLREVVAVGNANSLYHVATARGRAGPPGINYVRGASITVAFDSGQVRQVQVDSAASGIYLEPEDSTATDSTTADSLGGARPGTGGSGAPTSRPAPPVPADSSARGRPALPPPPDTARRRPPAEPSATSAPLADPPVRPGGPAPGAPGVAPIVPIRPRDDERR